MRVQPVNIKVNKPLPQKVNTRVQKNVQTPVKDAVIVLAYTSLPMVIYESVCFVKKKLTKNKN